ncbi:MAG: M20/M25/M40 family metallo-hydrolase [Bryobacteraceae bacterium]|nr:M20/M25/M40 family metallo-hydrolase [Bryobacteraceae bacterium]
MRFFLLFAVAGLSLAQQPDWTRIQAETLEHFSNLLKIDTSNPPGNETKAVEYLKAVLDKEGIPSEVLFTEASRANLVARLKGNGSKRPVIVMGHTDVVGVQREKWSVDPFAAIRKDGFLYGRGAVDDKDNVVASLMTLILLKRQNVALDRDVIFIAESGEEGSPGVGIIHLVNQHWPKIEAEYCLGEGGGIGLRDGKPRYVEITTTEKVGRGARLIAKGTAGHGSRPGPDNAIVALANAVAKVSAWEPPVRLNDTTRAYFERLATVTDDPEAKARYNGVLNPAKQAEIVRYFARKELGHASIVRTSISPTILQAGFRSNVIPSEAEATLDIRAVPGEDMNWFYDQMRKVISDPNVEVVAGNRSAGSPGAAMRPSPPPSALNSEMFQALEAVTRRMFPGAIALPSMLTAATDMAMLRAKGVQSYGIGPAMDITDGGLGGAHADDERIRESAIHQFVEFTYNAVLEIAASRKR